MLVLGFFMCFFHLYVVKDYKLMLILVSCESFNWIMICYIFSVVSGLLLFLYYFFFRVLIIPVFSRFFEVDFEWLVVIVYINVPLGVSFFVKVLTLSVVMPSLGFWVVLVFFLIFMNFISIMVWLIKKSIGVRLTIGGVMRKFYVLFGLFLIMVC